MIGSIETKLLELLLNATTKLTGTMSTYTCTVYVVLPLLTNKSKQTNCQQTKVEHTASDLLAGCFGGTSYFGSFFFFFKWFCSNSFILVLWGLCSCCISATELISKIRAFLCTCMLLVSNIGYKILNMPLVILRGNKAFCFRVCG